MNYRNINAMAIIVCGGLEKSLPKFADEPFSPPIAH
jgi:hypothetical protein